MNADDPTDGESVDLSTSYQSAREFLESEEPRADGAGEGPTLAKGIIWYDQTTPIFACCRCHEHVAGLRFEGEHFDVADYDERRAEAYNRLINSAPDCDVCAGRLPDMVDA